MVKRSWYHLSELHPIDRPNGKYKKIVDLERFMVFCILDTACTYKMVCNTFDKLEEYNMTTRKGLKRNREAKIEAVLKVAGYRFPKTHAKRIKAFGDNDIDLKKASRKELVDNVKGIGLKLASFFLRNTRGEDHAVLDVHTLRWLEQKTRHMGKKYKTLSYEDKEKLFKQFAKKMGMDTMALDLKIWQENRVGNK